MMGANSDSLFLVTRAYIHRIQAAGTVRAAITESLPRHPEESLGESVGMMIRTSQGRLGRVWIACTDAWVGEIELERRVAHAIGDAGLEETLAFEAENLSGIPGLTSRIASIPQTVGAMAVKSTLPAATRSLQQPAATLAAAPGLTTANHLVLQIDGSELDAIEDEIKQHRGKLMGIGSAAILQLPAGNTDGVSMIVSELESGTILSRHLATSTLTVMTADRFDLARWQQNFADSLGGPLVADSMLAVLAELPEPPALREPLDPAASTDLDSGTGSTAGSGCQLATWDDPELILRWSRWWLEAAREPQQRCLLVKPQAKPISNTVWTSVAIAAAMLIGLGCLLWQYRAISEIDQLRTATDLLRENSRIPAQLQRAIETAEKQLAALDSEVRHDEQQLLTAERDSRYVRRALEVRQQRWQQLLEAISNSMGPACFIESIQWTTDAVAIEGHSETAAVAHQVADDLGSQIGNAGWQVEPARTEFGDTGLYRFRLLARPTPTTTKGART